MPNIFYAKEVYKTYRDNDNKHFVRLKGLYVAGKFKPPFYMDPLLLVTNLNTSKAIVYHMTEHADQIKSDDMLVCIQNKFISHGSYVKFKTISEQIKGADDMLACIQTVMLPTAKPYLKLSQQYGSNYPGECILMINELTTTKAVIVEN